MVAILSSLYIYPVKSCAALAVDFACAEPRGLVHDRRWMVVDDEGRFLTGRQVPRLTLLRAQPQPGGLTLNAPGMSELSLIEPVATTPRTAIAIWDNTCSALAADTSANAWISAYLGRSCRLIHMDSKCSRPSDPAYSQYGDEVSFADGYPLLLISEGSLDLLNVKLENPVSMLRFRPNLVVAGTAPHAEDHWKRIRIGEIEFDVVKSCIRCLFTTVDFEQGAFAPDGEPLKTLIKYRRGPNGVTFGQNLIPRTNGQVRIGETVTVLEAVS